MYKQTKQYFSARLFNKYGNKVELVGEYFSTNDYVELLYHCENHGTILTKVKAKNALSDGFSPCVKCKGDKLQSSLRGKPKNDHIGQYNRLLNCCSQRGGRLVSKEWITSSEKYEVDCGNSKHPNFFNSGNKLLSGQWCPYCSGRKGDFQSDIRKIVSTKHGELLSDYKKATEEVLVKCNRHDYIWSVTPANIKKGSWCPVCNLPFSEKVVYDYLKDNDFNFKIQYSFDDLVGMNQRKYRFDFAIFDKYNNILFLLEIDDNTHRMNYMKGNHQKAKRRDEIKTKYCTLNNIQLHRIEFQDNRKEYKDCDFYYNLIHMELSRL